MVSKITRKQSFVLNVIRLNPGVENDDDRLIAAVWRKEGWDDGRSLEDNLRKVSNPETITRCRRKLHEMGMITYAPKVEQGRYDRFIEERDEHSSFTQQRFV